ncbi:HORM2 protein, partial [Pedionomus torquatus]|nr:HORM2 protein [Pedionomus torquatus]
LFPSRVATEQESVALMKRLLAISMSCITYMRGLFPESSYGTRYLDDLCLKILREDKSCLGSLQIVKWLQGCFDALERQYVKTCFFFSPLLPNLQTATELYQFKFRYKKEVLRMDISSNQMNFVNGVCCEEDIKEASRLLIRKLYLLMQNLGPLPNDVTLTMKLLYYNDVTPKDYQPPGFKEEGSPSDFFFDGEPVNLRVGSISTGFHLMKVRVTTEKKRMRTVESNLIQKNGPTEISHQGLDCDEEEEEGNTKISCLNLAFSQEEVTGPKKKRKVSEPEKLLLEGRK